jgi:hypothetical protein
MRARIQPEIGLAKTPESGAALMKSASVRFSRGLAAPIRAGEVLGIISIPTEDGGELTGTLAASRDVTERKPALPFFGGFSGQGAGETQAPAPEAATPEAKSHVPAPQAGASLLTILRALLGLFAAMTLVVAALRIRRTLRRRRRAQLKKRQAAYARARRRR